MKTALKIYRILRVLVRQLMGYEPYVRKKIKLSLTYHGNSGYGGWKIPRNFIAESSIIVDVGLGEDISFSQSLISKYGCVVHGFDPTPKAIDYVERIKQSNFILHKYGMGSSSRSVNFYLPNVETNVSGSIEKADHVGARVITVELFSLEQIIKNVGDDTITLLKMDIEGAEYEVIDSLSFERFAKCINILCIEFHHRWKKFGPNSTRRAVKKLESLGFVCVWRSMESNEEFTFVRK